MNWLRSVTRTAKFKLAFASPCLQKCGTVDLLDFQPLKNHGNIVIQESQLQYSNGFVLVESQQNQQFHTFAKMDWQMPA